MRLEGISRDHLVQTPLLAAGSAGGKQKEATKEEYAAICSSVPTSEMPKQTGLATNRPPSALPAHFFKK